MESLEREGERENAQGRARQDRNDVLEETDGVPGTSVGKVTTSAWSSKHLVTGLYDNPATAGKAYQDLTTRHGYKSNDISVVMSDATRKRHFGDVKPGQEFEEGSKAAEGAGIGGGIGIGVGAALGALVAAATAIAIPGIGLVVAGPIAGAIAGAGAGSATGTLVGALFARAFRRNALPSTSAGSRRAESCSGRARRTTSTRGNSSATSRAMAPGTCGGKNEANWRLRWSAGPSASFFFH